MKEYDIFISYRRDGGFELAQVIYEKLSKRGYRVFMDIESLKSGKFNERLYHVIAECTDFILILSPDALDRCRNEDDWVRLEIEFAMKQKKNIVPIQAVGFQDPDNLPASMQDILSYNRVLPTHSLFNEAVDKMCREFLHSKPSEKPVTPEKQSDLIVKFNKFFNLISFILLFSFLLCILTRGQSTSDASDMTTVSGIIQFLDAKVSETLPEQIRSFYNYLTNREFVHNIAKHTLFVSIFLLLALQYSHHNTLELLKENFRGRNFQSDIFSGSIDNFVSQLMLIEHNDLISDTDTKREIFPRERTFEYERRLKYMFLGSVNGDCIDYAIWYTNSIFSIFFIGEYATTSVINKLLAENGFAFVEKKDGICLYRNDVFELRIDQLFLRRVIELRRHTISYSCFSPVHIGFDEIRQPYPEFIDSLRRLKDDIVPKSCFSKSRCRTEDAFAHYQVLYTPSCRIEAGSCDGTHLDYFLCFSDLLNDNIQQCFYYLSKSYHSNIRLFGAGSMINKDNVQKQLEQLGCTCLKSDKKHLVCENDDYILSLSYFNFSYYFEVRRKAMPASFGGIEVLEQEYHGTPT